jgi:ABC-2 type transport system ATP-binding protein
MPTHSAPVDENTGSRQRITLFGRRRTNAAAGVAATVPATRNDAVPPKQDDAVQAKQDDPGRTAASTQADALPAEASQPEQVEGSDLLAELVRETEASRAAAGSPIDDSGVDFAELVGDSPAVVEPAEDEAAGTGALVEERGAGQPQRARRAAPTRAFPPARPAPPSSAPVVLAVTGLHKRYGDVVAVDGVNLTVRAGSMYGIVGPNGAGKTTTLSILTGLLRPDAGHVYVNGVDARKHPRDAKHAIGVLPDHLRTFDRLTGAQLLYYAGTLRGLDATTARQRSADLAAAFGIEDAMGRLVADYSAGMTKKVSLAAAMIHSPRLLVLDEPFEGVDPVSAATVSGILRRYVDAGGTVLLSSHGMDLVQRICDSVAIIVGGVVLDSGPVDEVRGDKTLEDHFIELAGGRKAVEGLEWLHSFSD